MTDGIVHGGCWRKRTFRLRISRHDINVCPWDNWLRLQSQFTALIETSVDRRSILSELTMWGWVFCYWNENHLIELDMCFGFGCFLSQCRRITLSVDCHQVSTRSTRFLRMWSSLEQAVVGGIAALIKRFWRQSSKIRKTHRLFSFVINFQAIKEKRFQNGCSLWM